VALILRVRDAAAGPARAIDPFVSVDWLEEHLGSTGPVVLDLRSAADYVAGHIPGSISVPFSSDSAWARPADGLGFELPPQDDLFKTIGDCGISGDSVVVLVGGVSQAGYPMVDTARVGTTLIYAGVQNVAILQGGFHAWSDKGLPVTTDVPQPEPVTYSGMVDESIFASTDYVEQQIGVATILDTRSAEVYSGAMIDPVAPKAGHIPTAKSLPTQSAWRTGGTYAPDATLEQLAAGVLGSDKDQPVIVYCTYGGTASCWWFVLTQVLGYRDVELYDGSAQAWVKDHDMVTGTGGS
jgi:thiosulfate/3-mercaptopyruvate sulfurtransferase